MLLGTSSINTSKKGVIGAVKHFAGKAAGKAVKFYIRHKKVIDPIVIPVALAAVAVVKESLDRNSRSTNQNETDVDDYFTYDPDDTDDDYSAYDSDPDSTNRDIIERSSPSGHIVTGHGQHYHTKEGTIWKDKDPYPRGKNLDE